MLENEHNNIIDKYLNQFKYSAMPVAPYNVELYHINYVIIYGFFRFGSFARFIIVEK